MKPRSTLGHQEIPKIKEEIEMKTKLMGLLKDEEGQGMVEYGLILGLISIVAIVIMGTLGGKITTMFTAVSNAF